MGFLEEKHPRYLKKSTFSRAPRWGALKRRAQGLAPCAAMCGPIPGPGLWPAVPREAPLEETQPKCKCRNRLVEEQPAWTRWGWRQSWATRRLLRGPGPRTADSLSFFCSPRDRKGTPSIRVTWLSSGRWLDTCARLLRPRTQKCAPKHREAAGLRSRCRWVGSFSGLWVGLSGLFLSFQCLPVTPRHSSAGGRVPPSPTSTFIFTW